MGKKTIGRKRHLVVDAIGLIIHAVVHAADEQDRDGAYAILAGAADGPSDRLKHVLVDAWYRQPLLELIV